VTIDLSQYSDENFAIYLAGFIDADGSIGITKRPKNESRGYTYTPTVQIGQKSSPIAKLLIEEIAKRYGGQVTYQTRPQRIGLKRGTIDLVRYYQAAQRAKPIIEAVLPYLIEKRERAQIVFDMLELNRKTFKMLKVDRAERHRLQEAVYKKYLETKEQPE